jgi:hypothetical protein
LDSNLKGSFQTTKVQLISTKFESNSIDLPQSSLLPFKPERTGVDPIRKFLKKWLGEEEELEILK